MIKLLYILLLAMTFPQPVSAQDAEKKPKEELGYAYILPLPVLTPNNASESEEIGALLPTTLLVDDSCVPKKIREAEKESSKPYTLQINNYRASKPILLNKANPTLTLHALGETNKPKFKWEIKSPESKEFLTLVFSNLESRDQWVKPTFQTIDCSVKSLPEGSLLILNYSPNELYIQLGKGEYIINKGETKLLYAPITEKLALSVVALNGKRKAFLFRNYINHKKGNRSVIVVYPKPSSGSFLKVAMTLADIPIIPAQD